jgi:glutamine cyclotransferase
MKLYFKIVLIIIILSLLISFYYFSNCCFPQEEQEKSNDLKQNNNFNNTNISEEIQNYSYQIINTYSHDKNAFTQGLIYHDGILFEGTGLYGESSLRKVDLETGNILQIHNLSAKYFGEGITVFGDKIIQLTWRSKVGFVYDKYDFELLEKFNYTTEGWGLTHDGTNLILSDGSANLYFLNPDTFELLSKIQVHDENGVVTQLNELEFINGKVFANVWQTDIVAIINPDTGNVTGWLNLEGLLSAEDKTGNTDVLNGIAYDKKNDRIFVTGKLWPKLFEIEMILMEN